MPCVTNRLAYDDQRLLAMKKGEAFAGVTLTLVHKHSKMYIDNVHCLFRALLHFGDSCTSVCTLSTKVVTIHELGSFVLIFPHM